MISPAFHTDTPAEKGKGSRKVKCKMWFEINVEPATKHDGKVRFISAYAREQMKSQKERQHVQFLFGLAQEEKWLLDKERAVFKKFQMNSSFYSFINN